MPIFLALAMAAALGAAPEPESKQVKLASPGISGVNLPKERADFFADHFAQELNNRAVRVITAKEVNAILGLARTQQLLGCDESSTSCMTELADALGVDGVITGSVGQFGPTYQANLVIVSNGDGRLLSSVTARADSEQQMLEAITVGARQAAAEVGAKLGKPARRFSQQSLFIDVVQLASGYLNLTYARALNPRWSIAGSFALGLNLPLEGYPGVGLTGAEIDGQVRFHFLDSPPFGLYLGGGLGFVSGYAFGTSGTQLVALGTSAFGLLAEIGYALALFDFLHLSLGLRGTAGVSHVGAVASGGGTTSEYSPLLGGAVAAGIGFAF